MEKFAFWILMLAIVFISFASTEPRSRIGLDVVPKAVLVGWRTFRIRVRIEPDLQNRKRTFLGDCGSDFHLSEEDLDKDSPTTFTWYEDFSVVSDCVFEACVYQGKYYCTDQNVPVGGDP